MTRFCSRSCFGSCGHRLPLGIVVLVAAAITLALGMMAKAQSPLTQGSWRTLPYQMPINPIHCSLLHSGKVLVVAGSENDPENEEPPRAAVWDPQSGTITVQNVLWDLFCNGMAALPDGRFLVVGGTTKFDPFYGESRATVFDPITEKFSEAESTAHGRFYATVTALSNGDLMAFGGANEVGNNNNSVEIYHLGSGWGPEFPAPWYPPVTYPRLSLLPNGNVFYSGELPSSHIFDPTTASWTLDVAHTVYGTNRRYGSSVLLSLRPEEGYIPRVLIMGGNSPATATTEIIDPSVPNPAWRMTAPMAKARIELNAVLLPTGKVLAVGGSAIDEDVTTAAREAELFDPATESWSSAGVARYAHLYHSVALLMPDATVWVAGSNPIRGQFEPHMEIYSPAYLFTTNDRGRTVPAPRPTITSVSAKIGYGATFAIGTPNSSDASSVVLIRPGSPSHAFDMEQRLVGLSFRAVGPGALRATAPPNGSIAPPGYYMLFILNRAGVPSLAKFVQLSSTPVDQPPDGTITSPAGDLTIQAGDSVNFAGSATDPNDSVAGYYWIFPDGEPSTSSAQSPGLVRFTEPGTHVVTMTAFDGFGVNDPSPPTRTITVEGPETFTKPLAAKR